MSKMARTSRKVRGRKRKGKNPWAITRQQRLFKTAESKTLEEFFIASIIGGITGGLGFALGNAIFKWFLEETNKVVPLPEALQAQIKK